MTVDGIKVPKYLEWFLIAQKKTKKRRHTQKSAQQSKSSFWSPQIIAQESGTAFELSNKPSKSLSPNKVIKKCSKFMLLKNDFH